jgi:nitroreductase
MSNEVDNIRKAKYNIQPFFLNRWSPRAFSNEPIHYKDIMAIIEAAHWAPSCFNEQPWRFIIADNKEKLEQFHSFITEKNMRWVINAPVIIAVLSKRTFDYNGKDNPWSSFDAGTAWGYMTIEALHRGLYTHAMGGFSKTKAREILQLPDEIDIITVVAVGKMGNKERLVDELKEQEKPSVRKEIESLIINNN